MRWTMTTRKSQSSEKKQTSEGESTSRNQESARKTRNRHQELATQESVKAGDAASEPRGKAESREVRRETEEVFISVCLKHETETQSQPATRSKAGGEAVSQ